MTCQAHRYAARQHLFSAAVEYGRAASYGDEDAAVLNALLVGLVQLSERDDARSTLRALRALAERLLDSLNRGL